MAQGAARGARGGVAAGAPLAVCGDFNIAPTDADVWDPAAFVGSTHVSTEERGELAGILQLGLTDVLPRALKGEPFTYWDYRAGMFHRGCGMRIDLVLLDAPLASSVLDAYIDRDARKGQKPSDHAPVVVDMRPANAWRPVAVWLVPACSGPSGRPAGELTGRWTGLVEQHPLAVGHPLPHEGQPGSLEHPP